MVNTASQRLQATRWPAYSGGTLRTCRHCGQGIAIFFDMVSHPGPSCLAPLDFPIHDESTSLKTHLVYHAARSGAIHMEAVVVSFPVLHKIGEGLGLASAPANSRSRRGSAESMSLGRIAIPCVKPTAISGAVINPQ